MADFTGADFSAPDMGLDPTGPDAESGGGGAGPSAATPLSFVTALNQVTADDVASAGFARSLALQNPTPLDLLQQYGANGSAGAPGNGIAQASQQVGVSGLRAVRRDEVVDLGSGFDGGGGDDFAGDLSDDLGEDPPTPAPAPATAPTPTPTPTPQPQTYTGSNIPGYVPNFLSINGSEINGLTGVGGAMPGVGGWVDGGTPSTARSSDDVPFLPIVTANDLSDGSPSWVDQFLQDVGNTPGQMTDGGNGNNTGEPPMTVGITNADLAGMGSQADQNLQAFNQWLGDSLPPIQVSGYNPLGLTTPYEYDPYGDVTKYPVATGDGGYTYSDTGGIVYPVPDPPSGTRVELPPPAGNSATSSTSSNAWLSDSRASMNSYWGQMANDGVVQGASGQDLLGFGQYLVGNAMQKLGNIGYDGADNVTAAINDPQQALVGGLKSIYNFGPDTFNTATNLLKTSLDGYSQIAEAAGVGDGSFATFRNSDPYNITPLSAYDNPAQASGGLLTQAALGAGLKTFGDYGIELNPGSPGTLYSNPIPIKIVPPDPPDIGLDTANETSGETTGSAAKVFTSPDPMVGETATSIERALPGTVKDVNVPIQNAELGLSSEADIMLSNGDVIEVKSGGGKGATTQLTNQSVIVGDDNEVMVYGPNLKPSIVNSLRNAGTNVFTNMNDLLTHIASKGGK